MRAVSSKRLIRIRLEYAWMNKSPSLLPSSTRLPSLDGWRAMAIATVMLSHFEYTRGFPGPWWWGQVFQGNLGVRIFFVISSFLITYLLLKEADRRGRPSLRAFYTRRVLRIFPVYFFYVGAVAALAAAGLYDEHPSSWLGTLTFTRNVVGRGDSVTVHYWSVAVEEQFYIAWPITLVVLGLWRRQGLAIGLLLFPMLVCPVLRTGFIQAHWNNEWVVRALGPFSITVYGDTVAVGCFGAFMYRAYRDRLTRFATRTSLAGAVVALVISMVSTHWIGYRMASALVPPVQAIATLCAIWVTLEDRSSRLYRVLNAPPVVWLGTVSYSLYVWQQLLLSQFAGPRLAPLPVYDWRLWWVAAIACACVSHYLVERPFLSVRDRFRVNVPDRPMATSPADVPAV